MNKKVQHRELATELRRTGNTYDAILRQVPVSRGTLSHWLRTVEIEPVVRAKLDAARSARIKELRAREVTVRKAAAVVRRGFAERDARREYDWLARKKIFEIGLGLLAGGGVVGKASVTYMSADERAVKLLVRWASTVLDLPAGKLGIRLYLPPSRDLGAARIQWSRATGLPADAFRKAVMTPETKRKPRNLAGIARIEIGGAGTATRIRTWLDELIVRYGE